MKKIMLAALCIISASCVNGRQTIERDIGREWCDDHSGQYEARLSDRTICDCLTRKYAVEVDFAGKWEAMEQSLHYARLSRRKPGILFICRKKGDREKIARTRKNLQYYNLSIRIWEKNCR